MIETKEAKVHYLSSNDNPIVRNKKITVINYDNYDFYILDEDKSSNGANLLFKGEDGEYWMFYNQYISFNRFNSLINDICKNEYEKDDCLRYCNYIKEKVKPIFDNYLESINTRLNYSGFFNYIELAYIEKNHPDLYENAKKSREQYIAIKDEMRRKAEEDMKERRNKEVKEKNQIFKDKITNAKIAIFEGKNVLSEILSFYKNDDYYKQTSQNVFLYLLKEYKIDVPLKTQGYINNKLYSYDFGSNSYRYYGKYNSPTFSDYLVELKNKIDKEYSLDKSVEDIDITDGMY